jgi:ATP adenylyltransferase
MQRLFAGWRMKYVASATRVKGCLFCALRKKGDDERASSSSAARTRSPSSTRFPTTPGHAMVAVNRHVGTVTGLNDSERADVWRLVAAPSARSARSTSRKGMNLGVNVGHCAGAGVVGHLHVHLVPRWEGDTNFMTVVGETKVLPEDLAVSHARLRRRSSGCADDAASRRGPASARARQGRRQGGGQSWLIPALLALVVCSAARPPGAGGGPAPTSPRRSARTRRSRPRARAPGPGADRGPERLGRARGGRETGVVSARGRV